MKAISVNSIRRRVIKQLKKAFYSSLKPRELLTIPDWADKYRKLPSESSSEKGLWRTSRFPYLKEIMLECSPQSSAKDIVIEGGSQVGKTEVAINVICYVVDCTPGGILYVQKTLETAQRFSKQRLEPSFKLIPTISANVRDKKSRDGTNTALMKAFPGGLLIMGGSNSAASLRSMPICFLITDEIDSFVQNVEGEGDPVKLAEKRTTNFPRAKRIKISTPTDAETSRIHPLYDGGDKRIYIVPCPSCSKKQQIVWGNIKWENNNPKTVYLKCINCESKIYEKHKTWMLENGEWLIQNASAPYPSFHISGLYSPVGFYSWADAVADYIEAMSEVRRGSPEKLKVFINTVLAEPWVSSGRTLSNEMFKGRPEVYKAEVPKEVLVLTAGVDVQDDRIEVEILGWGINQETYGIEYVRFDGDTEHEYVWKQLDDYITKTWKHESGHAINVLCAAIDSGHRTKIVYSYCKQREFRRFFPVKGVGGWGHGFIKRPKVRNQYDVWLFLSYPDEIKSRIYSNLNLKVPGKNYCHFPEGKGYDDSYFEMLVSEKLVPGIKGKREPRWELPSGRRNEALDCRGLNHVAIEIAKPNFDKLALESKPRVVASSPPVKRTIGTHKNPNV
jgi:phage terminase large subunit GpA-like protein